jgi:hypothetical protein
MLQRIQTVFLALVVLLGIVFMFIPVIEYEGIKNFYQMNSYHTISHGREIIFNNVGVGVLGGIITLLSLTTIFLYKNRSLQMKLGKLNILLIAAQIAAIVFYNDAIEKIVSESALSEMETNIQLGAIIPVVNLILTYLAIHFIKKDDKLVRAADRLR